MHFEGASKNALTVKNCMFMEYINNHRISIVGSSHYSVLLNVKVSEKIK